MATVPMTDAEYVAAGGQKCPFCGSDAIEGGLDLKEGRHLYIQANCVTCGEFWTDAYTLTGYSTGRGGRNPTTPDEEDLP